MMRNTLAGGLTYEFDFWDQIHNQIAAGEAAAQATGAELAFLRLSLQAELANDYLLLRGLDAEQDLLKHTVAAYQRALDVAQNRFAGKISPAMDVTRAEAQLESARAQLDDVGARRALAEHAIATLVAVPAPAFSIPPSARRDQAAAAAAQRSLLAAAATTRYRRGRAPGGRVQRHDRRRARRVLPEHRAERDRRRAGGQPQHVQRAEHVLLARPDAAAADLRGRTAACAGSGDDRGFNVSTADYRNTVLTAFQEVEDALAQLHYYGVEGADDQRALAAAQRTLDMSMALYQDGAANFLEVVVAQESLLGTQQLLLQLQTQYLQAGVRLVRALGGGWSRDDLPKLEQMPLYHVNIAQ